MKKMKKTVVTLACLGLAFAGVGAYNVSATQTAQADGETVTPNFACAGASIRLDSQDATKTGIRFRVKMETNLLETVGADNVRILVMPTDLIGEDNELTVEDDAQGGVFADWQNFVNDDGTPDSTYKQAYAYIHGMSDAEWNRPTTWRAYYMNGETPVYSDQMERSLSQVALSLENDTDETTERREMAKNYIKSYTVTYDFGVRDTDGEWKTTKTENVRFGTDISTLTAPTPETRDDFEFLSWEATKGADKLKEDGEKTIVTGNVTKEAYWLLTGEISLDSVEDVAKYADFTSGANTQVKDNPTSTGVAFAAAWGTGNNVVYANLDWKNIVVNTNLNCRFKGYITSAIRSNDNATGATKLYFETGETDQSMSDWIQNKGFDIFKTQNSSTFTSYGNQEGYYELANVVVAGASAVHVKQTATFEKFQIGAVEEYTETHANGTNSVYKNSNWDWTGDTSGFNIVGSSYYKNRNAVVSESYFAYTATKISNGNNTSAKFLLDNNKVSLKVGDKIIIKMKADQDLYVGLNNAYSSSTEAYFNGGDTSFVSAGEFGTAVLTVKKVQSYNWLLFRGVINKNIDFVIESIEVESAITTDVPQSLSGANEGAQSVTLDNTTAINQGVVTTSTDVTYKFTDTATTTWGGDAVTFNFKNIALKAGDTIYIKATATVNAKVKVNGNDAYILTASETCDGVVFTASEDMTLTSLSFHIDEGTYSALSFTVEKVYIVRA